jgi:lipopolysaccharide export system ATP-binding protein
MIGAMLSDKKVLAVQSLFKTYNTRTVVRDVSLQVREGEIVGLLGPNGAGKTTIFYIIAGLTQPNSGAVLLDGMPLTRLAMHQRARLGIGYLPQEASIFRRMSVCDNLLAILETRPYSPAERLRRMEMLLEEFGLMTLRHVKGNTLSGGERRRVELARLLATRPRFILLDEPFTGIDPIMVREIQGIVSYLKNKGLGILITDHRVRETLEITNRAYVIHGGTILRSGTPKELVESPEVKKIYLGEEFTFNFNNHMEV